QSVVAMFGMGLYENHVEGRFQVSVRRVLCDSWRKLVSILVSYCSCVHLFFLWIHYNVPGVFAHSWLYPFRPVFDLLLRWLREEISHVDTLNLPGSILLIRSASYAEPNALRNAIS